MSNIKSLDDLNKQGDDGDRKYNDYYAGGEKSGQLIRGPPEDEDSDDDGNPVSNLFNRARRQGATQGTAADLPANSGSTSNNEPFFGLGRKLAEVFSGPQQALQKVLPQQPPKNHVITFYKNGVFTVNNGPARSVTDPANFAFIESISKGECPAELEAGGSNAPVTVNLIRKDEDYRVPEPKKNPFQGQGQKLGSSEASTSSAGPSTASASATQGHWEGVDESKPTTSIQLRMKDGTRMVAKFNHSHKVLDIRRFIRASRPDMTGGYQLMTGFPSAIIANEEQTLADAGLLNAVIIQK